MLAKGAVQVMQNENLSTKVSPPPLPEYRKPFSATAGKLSLVFFLVVMGVGFAHSALKNSGYSMSPRVAILGFAAVMLLLVAGVVCGIVALAGLRKHGRPLFGVLGIILNGLIIFIGVTNFFAGRMRALEAQRKVERSLASIRQEMKGSFNPTNGLDMGLKPINQLKKSLENASAESQGEQKLCYQAAAAYAAKMQIVMAEFDKATKKATAAKILEPYTVESKDQLDAKRQRVEEFLAANDKFASFVSLASNVVSNELINANVPKSAMPKFLEGFELGQRRVKPLLLKIRSLDSDIGHASLEMIDLLATNWGNWQCDRDTGQLISTDDQFREDYNRLLQRIKDDQKEEVATQSKLVNLK